MDFGGKSSESWFLFSRVDCRRRGPTTCGRRGGDNPSEKEKAWRRASYNYRKSSSKTKASHYGVPCGIPRLAADCHPNFDNAGPSSSRPTGEVRREAGWGPSDYKVSAISASQLIATDSSSEDFRAGCKGGGFSTSYSSISQPWNPCTSVGEADDGDGVRRGEAGPIFGGSEQPSCCSVGSEPGFDYVGVPDCLSRIRPYDRAVQCRLSNWKSGSSRTCSPSSRTGHAQGNFLQLSPSFDGPENGPNIDSRDHPSGDDSPRDFGHSLSGAFRGLWEDERMGADSVPGHDSFGLPDGRELRGSKRHGGSFGSHPRARGSGQWAAGDCKSAIPARRCAFRSVHEQADQCHLSKQSLCTSGGPAVGDLRFGLPEGDGRHCNETSRVYSRRPSTFCRDLKRCRSKAKAKARSKEERQIKRNFDNRGGDSLDEAGRQSGQPHPFDHDCSGGVGGLESNPLRQTISFRTWALCLPRWILSSRTSLGWHLFRSFTARWRRTSSSTATMPLPVPYPGCFGSSGGGGPRLCSRRLARIAQQRALHIAVVILNRLYLGRFASLDELERCPNSWQRKRLNRLRAFYVACGSNQDEFPLAPGRSGPELGAMLFQLERFAQENPLLSQHYHDPASVNFVDDPDLLPVGDYPELAPYKALDVSRLKLVGQGLWPMDAFLDDALWLPFVEPRFLAHGEEIDYDDIPNFQVEDEAENLRLVKLWDARGLAKCCSSPLWPGQFSRVFNAHKSDTVDRQIGDRRLPNAKERHMDGPSKHLPPGPLLCSLWVPRYSHCLRGSITDRRDFYHQAKVTFSRARSNCLPFAFKRTDLAGLTALEDFDAVSRAKKSRAREVIGDELGPPRDDGLSPSEDIFVGFNSLYQGDHLGVEFALSSHQRLLQDEGLLPPEQRTLGHFPVPNTDRWQALVIDDFFCVSSQPISTPKADSFAFKALVQARDAYDRHALEGSVEKDVVAERIFKAAGAEVNSGDLCTNLGMALVSAPIAKRIGLSTLSLRAARLPSMTSRLASRLSGNWVSVLLYRRCWSSLVSGFFALAASGERDVENSIFALPRQVAEEPVCLAAVVPLIATNIATPYSTTAFASDASMNSGAVVATELQEKQVRHLWLGSNKKGHYTKLDNGFAACLRAVGYDEDQNQEEDNVQQLERPYKAPLLYFDFVEICGGSGVLSREAAELGLVVAPVLDLTYSEHYDLGDLRFLEWVMHMICSRRFRSFFLEPPCTTFSPAAYPACRSYQEPLGFNRCDGKTFVGNLLAFRSFVLLRVGRAQRTPSGLEQPRRSKMAWTPMWRALLRKGFEEAVVASCQFGSIHQKEFRLLIHRLSVEKLQVKCPGGHTHIPIQGRYTKPSATYVIGLARHIALEFRRVLELSARDEDNAPVVGFESILGNDVLLSSTWTLLYHLPWKFPGHINVLEAEMALKILKHQSVREPETRFLGFLDSRVAIGALAKGRSSSWSLAPVCRKAAALQVIGGLYPGWNFSPTRLNPADDPTRGSDVRSPCSMSITALDYVDFQALHAVTLPRPYANWVRLLLLLSFAQHSAAQPSSSDSGLSDSLIASFLNATSHLPWFCFGCSITSHPFLDLLLSLFTATLSICALFVLAASVVNLGKDSPKLTMTRPRVLAFLLLVCHVGAMEPGSTAERLRAEARSATFLIPTRTVRQETRDGREKLLKSFGEWLWRTQQVSLSNLLAQKPADPEEICRWLVAYGQEMFVNGKAYGTFSETINAIGAARPLIRKQLAPVWDLAFAWLADEPHQHHPALPLSVLLSVLTTCLWWGWPLEAAIFALAWNGILRKIQCQV